VAANTSTSARTGTMTIAGQTFTVNQNPALAIIVTLTPTTLDFTATVGQSNPTARAVAVQEAHGLQVGWTASTNVSWATIDPTTMSGTTQSLIKVSVNIAGMSTSPTPGQLTVSSPTSAFVPLTATIALTLNSTGLVGNTDNTGPSRSRVDGYDLIRLARAFGSKPGDLNWDPAVNFIDNDSNGNGAIDPSEMMIDGSDLAVLARNFGKTG